jgi:hypothetical protein
MATRPQADVAGSLATSRDAIDCVQLWHAWQLIGVRWRFNGCSWSDGVRSQVDRVEVEQLAGVYL